VIRIKVELGWSKNYAKGMNEILRLILQGNLNVFLQEDVFYGGISIRSG